MVHSICDLECFILKGDFSNNTDRLKGTNSHSQIDNRHTRPSPRLRLSYTLHALPQVIHLSLHPQSLDAWLTPANSGHTYFTQQRSFVNRYFNKWRTTPSTHTPLKLDFHIGTVATLTSLYSVHLLTSVDVVYIVLYIELAYLMLFAALSNAVCLYNASFFHLLQQMIFVFMLCLWLLIHNLFISCVHLHHAQYF